MWVGRFGDEYTARNLAGDQTAFFAPIVTKTGPLNSVIEFGANVGLNLLALRNILPDIEVAAVEINRGAAERLKQGIPDADVHIGPAETFAAERQYDLVLSKTLLVHIHPDNIQKVYGRLHWCCGKYILLAEYFNPRLMQSKHRDTIMWKRDFAGEMLDRFSDLGLVDYGFVYHRDEFPQDDITWFLLRR